MCAEPLCSIPSHRTAERRPSTGPEKSAVLDPRILAALEILFAPELAATTLRELGERQAAAVPGAVAFAVCGELEHGGYNVICSAAW